MSLVCQNCQSFQVFKDKCWFFWEGKRACSQHRASETGEPAFFSVEDVQKLLRGD